MSSFCQIGCRGVSHTPESVHVDKLAHPGVCDTPLHWLFADIQLRKINQSKICSQSEMNCEKSFVMQNEVKHLGCAHVDVYEILHVRSG